MNVNTHPNGQDVRPIVQFGSVSDALVATVDQNVVTADTVYVRIEAGGNRLQVGQRLRRVLVQHPFGGGAVGGQLLQEGRMSLLEVALRNAVEGDQHDGVRRGGRQKGG